MHFPGFALLSWVNLWRNLTWHATGRKVRIARESSSQADLLTNEKPGLESHKRRKMIINARLANETIFESIQSSFKNQFNTLAERLQEDILAANMRHLSVIRNTLNIVRNDNIALESEKNPQFRNLVDGKVKAVLHEIRRIQDVVGSSDTA